MSFAVTAVIKKQYLCCFITFAVFNIYRDITASLRDKIRHSVTFRIHMLCSLVLQQVITNGPSFKTVTLPE